MRDDIHKGAPVSRPWRGVARACTNSAAWQENGPLRAEIALVSELRGSVSSKFLKSLKAILQNEAQPGPAAPPVNAEDLRRMPKTQFETLIVDHTLAALSRGLSRQEAHEQGFISAVHEFKESICRTIEAHVTKKEPGSARVLGARLRHVMSTTGRQLSQALLRGRLPQRTARPKKSPSLDVALPLKRKP